MHYRLNVKCKTSKLPEDNNGKIQVILHEGDTFLDKTPKAQSMKEIIGKWIPLKFQTSALKRQCQDSKKTSYRLGKAFSKTTSDKVLSKI